MMFLISFLLTTVLLTSSSNAEFSKLAEDNGHFILSTLKNMGVGPGRFGGTGGLIEVDKDVQLEPLWEDATSLYVFFLAPYRIWEEEMNSMWQRCLDIPDTLNTNGIGWDSKILQPVYIGITNNVRRRYREHTTQADGLLSNFKNYDYDKCDDPKTCWGDDITPEDYVLWFAWNKNEGEVGYPTRQKFYANSAEDFFLINFDFPRNSALNGKYRFVEEQKQEKNVMSPTDITYAIDLLKWMVKDLANLCETIKESYEWDKENKIMQHEESATLANICGYALG